MQALFIKSKFFLSLLIINLLLFFSLNADDMFEPSCNDLKNPDVISAAKYKQSIENAPAIIDVITNRQIKDFQASNLYELISYLPGVEVMETYWGRMVLQFRGILNIHYNNKILLLINGSPMYEPVNGTFFLEAIPVNSIRRIEIIRGPGSSMYGTNAYSGVINIITYKGNEPLSTLDASFKFGSFNSIDGEINTNLNNDVNSGFFLAGEVHANDGYKYQVESDEAGNGQILDNQDDNYNVFGNYSNKNIAIDILYSYQKNFHYGIVPVINFNGIQKHHIFFINAVYDNYISPQTQFMFKTSFNYYNNPETSIGKFPSPSFDADHLNSDVYLKSGGQTINSESQLTHKFCDKLSIITGFVYNVFVSDEYQFLWADDNSIHQFTAYSEKQNSSSVSFHNQMTWDITDKFKTTSGIRIVKDSDIKEIIITPRTGFIYKLTDKLSTKLLYGKAYRAPTFFEKYVETYNVLWGSKNLKQEKIQSVDFALEGHFKNIDARLNVFDEHTRNGIIRVPVTDTLKFGSKAVQYENYSEMSFHGFEFSMGGVFESKGYWGLNFGWKSGEEIPSKEKLLYFSEITANAWCSRKLTDLLTITSSIQYIGERDGFSERNNSYTLDDYILTNISTNYKYNNISFTFSVRNIFDTEYTYPEFVRRIIDDIPGGPGRSLNFSISYNKL